MKIEDTKTCREERPCTTCRDLEGGRAWREKMRRHYETDGVDWPCPRGHDWGFIGKSRGVGDTVAKAIKRVTGGRVKPCGGCRKRQAALNKVWPYSTA